MTASRIASLAAACLALGACQPAAPVPEVSLEWTAQTSGVSTSLRGLAVVSGQIAWIGAPDGVALRTIDGGASWTQSRIAAADGLDLRSVHGFDANHALFFTAGSPARLFETRDGGASFTLVYDDASEQAFFDGLGFWNENWGMAFSDPVDGAFHILRSEDGGQSWTPAPELPTPLEGEAGFAASDTSLALGGEGRIWIGTGGGAQARVLIGTGYGANWTARPVPLASGAPGAGVFSIAAAGNTIVAVGGDYTRPDETAGTAAWSLDGGHDWFEPVTSPSGYRSAVTALPGLPGFFLATGPNGSDLSRDGGRNWQRISDIGFNAIAFAPGTLDGWAAGSDGRISRVRINVAGD